MNFFAASARSAVGLVRTGNEDSALISDRLVAVADGMGGHAAGEVASKIAITELSHLIPVLSSKEIDTDSADDIFSQSLELINSAIKGAVSDSPELTGMGTTLTAALLREDSLALLHIGDSRAYRLRGNSLEQLSVDHTVIQELLHQGAITEAEVANHPQRSVLTQVLMGEREQEAVIQVVDVKAKDRFLLCSDGLSSVLSEKEIKSLIKGRDRAAAIDALIDATYINGAPDNVTVVIADITESSNNEKIEAIGAAQ
jgi:serine/threonine protein phosphatase PrpC